MVHLDKVEGQKGSMVLNEDGSVVSSTGELSSSEVSAQTLIQIISHSLPPVDFTPPKQPNGHGQPNDPPVNHGSAKWNRVTVSFPDHSYVACLSNRRIHIVKREHAGIVAEEAPGHSDGSGDKLADNEV